MKERVKKNDAGGGRRKAWVPWILMAVLTAFILGSTLFPSAAFSENGNPPTRGEQAEGNLNGTGTQGSEKEPPTAPSSENPEERAMGAEVEGQLANGNEDDDWDSYGGEASGDANAPELFVPAGSALTQTTPWKVTSLDISKDVDAVYPTGYSVTLDKTAQPTSVAMEVGEKAQVEFTITVGIQGSPNTYYIEGNIFVENTGEWPADVTAVQDTVWYKAGGPDWLPATSSITTTVPIGQAAIPTGGPHTYSYSGTFTLPVPLSQVTSLSNLIEITISNKPDPPPPGMKNHTFHYREDFAKPSAVAPKPLLEDQESIIPETGLVYQIISTTINGAPAADPDGPWELDPSGAPYTVVITKELTATAIGTYTLSNRAWVGQQEDTATVEITVIGGQEPECGGLEGYKYEDSNRNGELDEGDSPWEGVTIQLWPGSDGVVALDGNGPLAQTTTDEEGHFSFPCLMPGTYLVIEVVPSGSESVGPPFRLVSVTGGQTTLVEPPFLNQWIPFEKGAIAGWKYRDDDADGYVDEGETGLGEVTIKLFRLVSEEPVNADYYGLVGSWVMVGEVVTGEDGSFSFPDLDPGIYFLEEEVPEGFFPTSSPGITAVLEGDETIHAVFLNAPMSRLSGVKVEYPNDEPVEGVEFTLTRPGDEDGETLTAVSWELTRVSGPDGSFDFGWLMPGAYQLRETVPQGWEPLTDPEVEVELGPGEALHIVFVNHRIPKKPDLHGFKWLDANGDGIKQPGEAPLQGVVIDLLGPDGLNLQTVTDENGLYLFEGLEPGGYKVSEAVPAGYYPTSPPEVQVALEEGESERVDFLNAPYADVWGVKWDDLDGNGSPDAGEGVIQGVTIRLTDSTGAIVGTASTLADGSYSFPELMAGIYTVEEIVPYGYENTAPASRKVELLPGEKERVDFFNRVPVAGEIVPTPSPTPPPVIPVPQVAGQTLPVTGMELALLLMGAGLIALIGLAAILLGARKAGL